MRSRNPKRAFTLIEILIVVVILGILAAIVIPQFTDASQDAMRSSVRSQLQTLRSQVELYKVQNGGVPTDLVLNQWADLVDDDYIQQAPTNPFVEDDGIADPPLPTVVDAAPGTGGWIWDGDDLFAQDPNGIEGDGDLVWSF